jgi:acyl-coenzyme A thioesterase PaaI-like protein
MATQSEVLARLWQRLSPTPGGTWLFSRLLGSKVPYSGTIGAHVRALAPGYCKATLRDRRGVRNHFDSIHALALANLGELVSGLAMSMALPPTVRGIPTGLTAEYLKKARGTLTAESRVAVPSGLAAATDHKVQAEIRDEAGDVVCRVAVTWRLSPR